MAQVNVKIHPAFVDSTISVDDAVFQKTESFYQTRYEVLVAWFLANYPELLPVLQDQLDNHHAIFSLQDGPGKTLQPFIPNEFIPHTVWFFKWAIAAEMQKALLWLISNPTGKAKITQGAAFIRALNNLMAAKVTEKQIYITDVLNRPQNDEVKRTVFFAMYGAQLQPEPGFSKWKGDYTPKLMDIYNLLHGFYQNSGNKYTPKSAPTGGGKLQFEVQPTEAEINAANKMNRPKPQAANQSGLSGFMKGLIERISSNKWTPLVFLFVLLIVLYAGRKYVLK